MLSVTHSKETGIVFNWRQVATKEGSDTEMFGERSDRVSNGICRGIIKTAETLFLLIIHMNFFQ